MGIQKWSEVKSLIEIMWLACYGAHNRIKHTTKTKDDLSIKSSSITPTRVWIAIGLLVKSPELASNTDVTIFKLVK